MIAEVAIAGAGVMGASIAWHLATLGVKNIVLFEREREVGLGSTGRATGGFRAQFGTDVNVRLSLLSRQKLLRFAEEVGGDPGYRQCGYLWLARTGQELARLRAVQAVQHAAGLREARLLGPDDLSPLNPAVVTDGFAGGAFSPTDGFIRPLQILRGYLDSAQRLGATLVCSAPIIDIKREGSRVTSIRTPGETISVGHLIDAAGAWAAPLAQLAGVKLPVAALQRQVAATVPTRALPDEMPMTIYLDDGFHLRVRDGRVLLLWSGPGEGDDAAWLAGVEERTRSRVPALAAVQIDRAACWSGLYEMSPDHHALLGRAPGYDNFWLANGSSGHGVMHAPAVGQLLAELITSGRAQSIDITALRPERFAQGAANPLDALL